MKRFSCGDVVPGCKKVIEGETEADILQAVADHAAQDHGITDVPPALVEQVKAHIQDVA